MLNVYGMTALEYVKFFSMSLHILMFYMDEIL